MRSRGCPEPSRRPSPVGGRPTAPAAAGAGQRGHRWPSSPQARRRRRAAPSPARTHFVSALRQLVHLLGVPRHGAGGEAAGGKSFVLRRAPRPQPSAATADSPSPSAAKKLSKNLWNQPGSAAGAGPAGPRLPDAAGLARRAERRGSPHLASPRFASAGRAGGPRRLYLSCRRLLLRPRRLPSSPLLPPASRSQEPGPSLSSTASALRSSWPRGAPLCRSAAWALRRALSGGSSAGGVRRSRR